MGKAVPVKSVLRETSEASGSVPDRKNARRLTVYAAYGRFTSGGTNFYGWTMLAERLNATGACTMHVHCEGGASHCPELPLPKSCVLGPR